jgi:Holliday junction resolvasome RuvABC endonuclease subunit
MGLYMQIRVLSVHGFTRIQEPNDMRILALDLGTHTGWALHLPDFPIESGVQEFHLARRESAGMRFLRFRSWLARMIDDHEPQLIVYEEPHLRGSAATHVLVGFATRVQELAARRGLEHSSIRTPDLKKHATGRGNAPKPLMVQTAKQKFPHQDIVSDDQADALWVLDWALQEFAHA